MIVLMQLVAQLYRDCFRHMNFSEEEANTIPHCSPPSPPEKELEMCFRFFSPNRTSIPPPPFPNEGNPPRQGKRNYPERTKTAAKRFPLNCCTEVQKLSV